MVFDEVEGHFNRCHPELVRAKEEHWDSEGLHHVDSCSTPMIVGIIKNKDSVVSPMGIC